MLYSVLETRYFINRDLRRTCWSMSIILAFREWVLEDPEFEASMKWTLDL